MASPVETNVVEDLESMSLQEKSADEDWEEDSEAELDSFITEDQEV